MMNRCWVLLRRSIAVFVVVAGSSTGAGLLARAAWAAPGDLVARDLGFLHGADTSAQGINNRGQVVGTAFEGPGGVLAAFLWDSGTVIDLGAFFAVDINDRGQVLLNQLVVHFNDPSSCFLRDGNDLVALGTPPGSRCSAADFNERGQVVGALTTFDPSFPFLQVTHAFLLDAGTFVDLGSLGGNWSMATAINDRGQIVGSSMTASGEEHAFLWEAGTMVDIGIPGGDSGAVAINNRGQIMVSDGSHLLLWEHGSLTDLTPAEPPIPGGSGDLAYVPLDINERDQVLTVILDRETGDIHAGLWEKGSLTPLPSLGGGQPIGFHLNNLGQVVGTDQTSEGEIGHAVLWTPGGARGHDDR